MAFSVRQGSGKTGSFLPKTMHLSTLGNFLLNSNISLKPTPDTIDLATPSMTYLLSIKLVPFFLLMARTLLQTSSRLSIIPCTVILSKLRTWLSMAGQNRMGAPPTSIIPMMRSVLNIWQQTANTQLPYEWQANTSGFVEETSLIRVWSSLACSSNSVRIYLSQSSDLSLSKQVMGKQRQCPGSWRKANSLGKGGAPGSNTYRKSSFLMPFDEDGESGLARVSRFSCVSVRLSLLVSSITFYSLVSVQYLQCCLRQAYISAGVFGVVIIIIITIYLKDILSQKEKQRYLSTTKHKHRNFISLHPQYTPFPTYWPISLYFFYESSG